MRILLVNKFHYIKGGSETYYFSLAEGLRSLGHEVFFFSMKDEKNQPCAEEDCFVSNVNYNEGGAIEKLRAGLTLIYSSEAKEKFETVLQRVRPDVVHLNLVHRQISLSILDAPSLKGVPVVFTSHDYILICPCYTMVNGSNEVCDDCLHGNYSSCIRNKCVKESRTKSILAFLEATYLKKRKLYHRIDRIIAPSQFMKAKLLEAGFSSKQVVYIQNFVNRNTLEEAKSPVSVRSPEKYFLYFGRLSKEKGVSTLLKAFSCSRDTIGKEWRLVIAGDGPMRKELDQLVAELDLAESVVMAGYKTGNDLKSLIEGAYFSLMCSEWRENMPYAILESFACGTPVIGSSIGGITEAVMHAKTGFTFHHGDLYSLSEALVAATNMDSNDYLDMRIECKRYVLKRCSQNEYLREITHLYRTCIAEKAACSKANGGHL